MAAANTKIKLPMDYRETAVLKILSAGDRPATYAEIRAEAGKLGKLITGVQNVVARLEARGFVRVTHHPTDGSESVSVTADGTDAIRPALPLHPFNYRERAILAILNNRDRPATEAEVEAETTCKNFTGTPYSVARTADAVAHLVKLGFVCVTHHPTSCTPLVHITADGANAIRATLSREAVLRETDARWNRMLSATQMSDPDDYYDDNRVHPDDMVEDSWEGCPY